MSSKLYQKSNPILISLSPNTQKDDIFLALRLIFKPKEWKKGSEIEKLENEFAKYLGVKYAISFNSARAGLFAILRSLQLEKNSQVLLQAFTCNAAVNPIIWAGLKPVFVDIDETLNLDPEDLRKKITDKSRVVMVQHTFGYSANLEKVSEICRKHNLILIEDCAHSLSAKYHGKPVGTFSKASFFSFGRDKIISSVFGGMVVTDDDELAKEIKNFHNQLSFPSNFWIFQQLLHPVLTNFVVIPLYGIFGIGRWVLLFLQKTRILSKAVHWKEKKGKKVGYLFQKMPNAIALLVLNQFNKLEKFILHQRKIAKLYDENLKDLGFLLAKGNPERVYMRYSVLTEKYDTDEILKKARKEKIFLDDGWRKTPITPSDTDQQKMEYILGSCPEAERISKNIFNLPTHINVSEKAAFRIINFLKGIE